MDHQVQSIGFRWVFKIKWEYQTSANYVYDYHNGREVVKG